jgi:hypothetical protein
LKLNTGEDIIEMESIIEKMFISACLAIILSLMLLPVEGWSQDRDEDLQENEISKRSLHTEYRHAIEIFPLVALAKIYSVQYTYSLTPRDQLIAGFAYLNIIIEDNDGNAIGQFHSPTIPIGYRRYLWRNLHAEYQLWPAYNRYFEKNEEKFYDGFDLYNEFRAGFSFHFKAGSLPLSITPQYVFGFGLWPGNKPESFTEANRENPVFHAPTLSVGIKF